MDSDRPEQRPRNVLPDFIIPLLALGFTGYYLTTITEVPWISQASAVTVSLLLVLAIAAYFVRTAARIKRGSEYIGFPERSLASEITIRRIALFALMIGYVALIDTFGFTLTTLVFIFLGIVALSSLRNWKNAALVAVCCSVTGYAVFIYLFETRFPRGPIENALKAWL